MKSSTIRRSTLSRETMEVIENLAREQEQQDGMVEYVRPEELQNQTENAGKAQEIDLLWQSFKTTQFNTNSPTAYILLGFLIGVVTCVIIGAIGFYSLKSHSSINLTSPIQEETLDQQADNAQQELDSKVNIPAEETVEEEPQATTQPEEVQKSEVSEQAQPNTQNMKKYVVKSGDTGESIIKHYYGSYTPERAEAIMKANNLKSLDRINIDQVLLIPVE